jgi:ATP-binding protein involved in chromosome partitioning
VLKAIDFSRKLSIRVAGVVENMCCFKCPDNGKVYHIFGRDAGRRIAEAAGVPFLGGIPIDPEFSQYLDSGRLHEFLAQDNETAKAILTISDKLVEMYKEKLSQQIAPREEKPKRISLLKLPGEEEEGG